jgi:hypothetical protein
MRTQSYPVRQASPNITAILLAADPEFTAWSDARQLADTADYDAWLTSPEGLAWLDCMAEGDLEARCLTPWEGW